MEKQLPFKEFRKKILEASKNKSEHLRKGQFIFNYIEYIYGEVAREVQFADEIDCFYDDDLIDAFITACYLRLKNQNNDIKL